MKAAIIGNGLAGTLAAKTLRELDSEIEIVLFAEETHPYYPRPNLIEFIAGRLPYERLFAFPEDWNVQQKITVHRQEKAVEIRPDARTVRTAARRETLYDVLLLASGCRPVKPPIKGNEKKGVFVLRTLDDALSILDYLKDHPRTVIVGGGLLGLEIARAVKVRGAAGVLIVEVMDRLLPRQLDETGAALLRSHIEKPGVSVRCATKTEEILGQEEATGLRFDNGETVEADLVILAAGVVPDSDLARGCGVDVGRGVVVDDRMRTSAPGIFAAGDVVEHRDRVYGIIPASFEQARVAAYNMVGLEKKYHGTIPSNTLKVAGFDVTSVGDVNPEAGTPEVIVKHIPEKEVYRKLILRDDVLHGAIWMGTKKGAGEVSRLVERKANVGRWKHDILEEGFDFNEILL